MTQNDLDRLKENYRLDCEEQDRHTAAMNSLLERFPEWTEERTQLACVDRKQHFATQEKIFVERMEILNRCDHRMPDGTDAYDEGGWDWGDSCYICGDNWDKVKQERSKKLMETNMTRHDLMTSGWSMMAVPEWPDRLLQAWGNDWPYQCEFSTAPENLQPFVDKMSWLLHEALPEEYFYLKSVEMRRGRHYFWHIDGGYLRVILVCQGVGTAAALSFENNVITPPGYCLIFTGQQRKHKTGIAETWHCAPQHDHERRLVVLNFRNGD